MLSYTNYWPKSTLDHSHYSDYGRSSAVRESSEERYSTRYSSRARSASPAHDRASRSFSVTRSELDLTIPERLSRALSVPPDTYRHEVESHRQFSKESSSQLLNTHDVVTRPFYRSIYFIKPRPYIPLYPSREYARSREDSTSPVHSTIREESIPRAFREPSYYEPRYLQNRESLYGGRYYSRYYSPFTKRYHYSYRYPFVSSYLFLPRYYTGNLTVPYFYSASRFHV